MLGWVLACSFLLLISLTVMVEAFLYEEEQHF